MRPLASRAFGSSKARSFSISPAVSGKTIWNLDSDGALGLPAGTYTLVALGNFSSTIRMWGGGGGGGYYNDTYNSPGNGGAGGYTKGKFKFKKGKTYILQVASGGERGKNTGYGAQSLGGLPGGGNSGRRNATHGAGGGGGYTGLFETTVAQANAILIAGGGGGGIGYDGSDAGAGGGLTSQGPSNATGNGSTQTDSGVSFWNVSGQTGKGQPLQGGHGKSNTAQVEGDPGGGGGGGYWGGSTWGTYGPGAGGSGFMGHPDVSEGVCTAGNYTTVPATTEPGYVAGVAVAGTGSTWEGAANMTSGGNGRAYLD